MNSLATTLIALAVTIGLGLILVLVIKKWMADDNKEKDKYYRVRIIALSVALFGMALIFMFKD